MAAANPSVSSWLSSKECANKLYFNCEVKARPAHPCTPTAPVPCSPKSPLSLD